MKHNCGNPACENAITELTRGQKGALAKGYKIYCCPDCSFIVSKGRNYASFLKRRKPPVKRNCRRCLDWFQPKSHNQQYCDDPVKRCAYKAMQERNKKCMAIYKAKAKAKKPKPEVKPKRKCRICGCDPSPNYFFCRGCHGRVNDSFDAADEHSVGIMVYQ